MKVPPTLRHKTYVICHDHEKILPTKVQLFLIQHRKNGKCKHCHHHHYLAMRTGLFLNWFTSVKPDRQKDQQRICHFSL